MRVMQTQFTVGDAKTLHEQDSQDGKKTLFLNKKSFRLVHHIDGLAGQVCLLERDMQQWPFDPGGWKQVKRGGGQSSSI